MRNSRGYILRPFQQLPFLDTLPFTRLLGGILTYLASHLVVGTWLWFRVTSYIKWLLNSGSFYPKKNIAYTKVWIISNPMGSLSRTPRSPGMQYLSSFSYTTRRSTYCPVLRQAAGKAKRVGLRLSLEHKGIQIRTAQFLPMRNTPQNWHF